MIGVNDYCKIERTVESKCELGNPFLSIKGLSENRRCNPLFNSHYILFRLFLSAECI